jgi:ArsR family transcriptional regulator
MAQRAQQVVTSGCCSVVGPAAVGPEEAADLARGFAALGDPVRLHLLALIAAGAGGEACVCDLVPPTGRSQPTVSHHLRILREAGLVVSEKRGTWAWYRLVPERLEVLRAALAPAG